MVKNMFCMWLQETYEVEDCKIFNDCTTNSFESLFSSIPSSFSCSYSSNGVTISNSGSYSSMILGTQFNSPISVEYEIIDHTSSAPTISYGTSGSTVVYSEYKSTKVAVDFTGTNINVTSTLAKWRYEIDTNEIRIYRNDSLVYTGNYSISTLALQLALSSNRSATIKNFKIKAL